MSVAVSVDVAEDPVVPSPLSLRNLAMAMIDRALTDAFSPVVISASNRESAFDWIYNDELRDQDLSFEWCCDVLGVSVTLFRKRLREGFVSIYSQDRKPIINR